MQIWSTSRISNEEKENILAKHREVYNGYQTMQPQTNNTQPLYVQDFAKDKVGAMVKNDGTVTPYTNYRINESHVMDTCEQCGGNLTEKECMECGWKMEETKEGYKTGKLDDIYDEEDLNMSDDFDYVEGGGNDYGTFEKMHHMKSIKNEATATSNAPLSYGKHYNEIDEPYDFKSNGPVGDGGTLRQKSLEEVGFTGGGNAADFDIDYESPAYDFESEGPIEDTYTEPADDMDLDSDEVKKPYDFISDGPETGDVYPVYEEMKSAWDEDLNEVDISGAQASQSSAEKPYAFVSTGPGKAGPYQTHSWGGEQLSSEIEESFEDEIDLDRMDMNVDDTAEDDAYWEEDLEPNELSLDLTKFNPEDKSWEEITAHTGQDEYSFVDESINENFTKQQEKILEMFERFKRYN